VGGGAAARQASGGRTTCSHAAGSPRPSRRLLKPPPPTCLPLPLPPPTPQAFAVFLPIKSVGVQGDQRTHSHVVGLRAVTSSDGMTADWFPFSPDFLRTVSSRICNKVRSVNRVVYDITSKPPSTIEWE